MNEKAFRKYIDVVRRAMDLMEKSLNEGIPLPSIQSLVEEKIPEIDPLEKQRLDRLTHIKALMDIDCWPTAIELIDSGQSSVEDQIDRARSLFDSQLIQPIDKMNFLDFGCGEGYAAKEAISRGAQSTGFDIVKYSTWDQSENVTFTTNFDSLKLASFDVIFLHDVIDHALDAENVMHKVKSLLKPNGLVYVRCHPWTAKHAVHLAQQGLNKAFIHLFLNTDELKSLGFDPMFTRTEKNPLIAYRWFFHDFIIKKERIRREALSDFFLVPSFKELVINEQQIPTDRHDSFFKDMEILTIDYCLSLPKE